MNISDYRNAKKMGDKSMCMWTIQSTNLAGKRRQQISGRFFQDSRNLALEREIQSTERLKMLEQRRK